MSDRSGLLAAFEDIFEVLSTLQGFPVCELNPLPPANAPLPSLYFFWDDETFDLEHSDIKWINPGNARTQFKIWHYFELQGGESAMVQLINKVAVIRLAIKDATTLATRWKGNVIKVIPMYGSHEKSSFAGVEITILIAEYL